MMKHNPGAPAAVAVGCTCSPEANHQGAGEPIKDNTARRWYLATGCPIHNPGSLPYEGLSNTSGGNDVDQVE